MSEFALEKTIDVGKRLGMSMEQSEKLRSEWEYPPKKPTLHDNWFAYVAIDLDLARDYPAAAREFVPLLDDIFMVLIQS